jgi:geranylgeranylglycerol-phosphate geranylgeranyltransferase
LPAPPPRLQDAARRQRPAAARPIARPPGAAASFSSSSGNNSNSDSDEGASARQYPPPHGSNTSNVDAYLQLARVHNIFPSILLALVGGAAAARSIPTALLSPAVWAAALASAGVAVASMAVNDYFDRAVDRVNRPDKPIPSGRVPADGAVLLAACLYIAVLAAACLMDPYALRAVIAFSSTVTMLYTPVLKKLPVVKNLTVAAVIALAPIAGALAVSGGGAGGAVAAAGAEAVRRLLPCAAFAFFGVVYREILMDIHDMDGDLAEGVVTVPALCGRGGALCAALASLGAGTAAALALLYAGASAASSSSGRVLLFELPSATATALGVFTAPVLELLAVLPALTLLALAGQCAALALAAARSGFEPENVDACVMACLKPMGLGIMLLAAVAAFGA